MTPEMPRYTALCPWFGSNRTLAENVGRALDGCRWVGVPFAGGMSELLHIKASTVVVGDLHAHVLNLATVVACPDLNPRLRERLDGLPCHPDVLSAAQTRCADREAADDGKWFGRGADYVTTPPDLDWAVDYFVCAWLSRNGTAGTEGEFRAPHSVRWDAAGGDSATRFRNATESLAAWQTVMRRCNFLRLHCDAFLTQVKDAEGHALYLDPPFPDAGEGYKYSFDDADQRRLARRLAAFRACAIVVRYYDHPLIRELYPEPAWTWHRYEGRKQTNATADEEVLITRRVT